MTNQKGEQRGTMSPIPENLDDYLTFDQRKALSLLEQVGWSIAFVRRSRHIPPIVVVASASREEYGVLLDNGEVDFPSNLKLRPGDRQAKGAA